MARKDGVDLIEYILNLPQEIAVIFVAALPVFELRGAIPLGIGAIKISGTAFDLPLAKVYFLALVGNMLPVFPLLVFFKYFFHKLQDIKIIGKFFRWWFRSVEKRSTVVQRWGFWGLILFVAIPLPVTGAWTGTVAATLFEVKKRKAFFAILIGVSIAGIIVSLLSTGVINFINS